MSKAPISLSESLSALKCLCNAIGYNVFDYDEERREFKLRIWSIICNFFFLTMLINVILSTIKSRKSSEIDNEAISQASGFIDLFSGSFIEILSTILNSIFAKDHQHLLNQIGIVDERFRKMNINVNYGRYTRLSIIGIFVVFFEFSVTFLPDYFIFVTSESYSYLFTSYFPIISNGVLKLYYVLYISFIYDRISKINRYLFCMTGKYHQKSVKVIFSKNNGK